jgi:hypothetical protein
MFGVSQFVELYYPAILAVILTIFGVSARRDTPDLATVHLFHVIH